MGLSVCELMSKRNCPIFLLNRKNITNTFGSVRKSVDLLNIRNVLHREKFQNILYYYYFKIKFENCKIKKFIFTKNKREIWDNNFPPSTSRHLTRPYNPLQFGTVPRTTGVLVPSRGCSRIVRT